jgi:hypothetical protein
MPGLYTPGLPALGLITGNELQHIDTLLASGASPQEAAVSFMSLAIAMKWLATAQDKTMVAGTRYYTSIVIGAAITVTGIQALVGSTGGTDLWNFEIHDVNGVTLATTLLTGTTAGTANLFQRIALTAALVLQPGTYFIAVQSNGTTAKLGTLASAGLPLITGSATGTLGTAASFTPATTYTANLGPIASFY